MLSYPDNQAIPQVSEVIDTLDGYADMLESALAEVPRRHFESMPYLPTYHLLGSCKRSVAQLDKAQLGLNRAQSFIRPLQMGGCWYRPVDLMREALAAVEETQCLAARHQFDDRTPASNVACLVSLADCVFMAEQDLQFLIGPTVNLLGRPLSTA